VRSAHALMIWGNFPRYIWGNFPPTHYETNVITFRIRELSSIFPWHWNCTIQSMREILLCTHNPMLIKSLYGVLRDERYEVEIADHPAQAVQLIMLHDFHAVIMDSDSFGLSADDAARIIKAVSPDIKIIVIGYRDFDADASSIRLPVDLEELKTLVHSIHKNSSQLHH